jgi:hypothetical protein
MILDSFELLTPEMLLSASYGYTYLVGRCVIKAHASVDHQSTLLHTMIHGPLRCCPSPDTPMGATKSIILRDSLKLEEVARLGCNIAWAALGSALWYISLLYRMCACLFRLSREPDLFPFDRCAALRSIQYYTDYERARGVV